MFNAMMEAFMEEVVGLFPPRVEVQDVRRSAWSPTPTVRPSRWPAQRADRPLGRGRADPDGSGVAVHVLDDERAEEAEEIVAELPAAARPQVRAKGLGAQRSRGLSYSAPDEDGSVKTAGSAASKADNPYAGVGRNAPCPCGSGKKFKMCHGRPGAV